MLILVRLRLTRGWGQDKLAVESHVSAWTIKQLESPNVQHQCRPGTALKLAESLGVEVRELFLVSDSGGFIPRVETPL